MKILRTKRLIQFVSLSGLLVGLVATGCDGILGIEGFEAGCLEGAKRCADNTPQTCGAYGQWRDEGPCAIGLCQDGYCVPECAPNEKGCDGNTPRECNESRVWQHKEPCELACFGGSCVMTCKSSDPAICIGNAPATCNEQGEWQTSSACFEQTCVNGACQGECVSSTKRCLGNTPQTCDASGQWESFTCEMNEICIAGTCGCISGDRRCFENRPQICTISNQWVNEGAPCTNNACDPDTVTCVGNCVPGRKQCLDTNTPELCDSKGQWQTEATCDLGCFDGVCATCTPNDLRCTGNTPERCNEKGQWQNEAECIDQTCIAGTCQGQCAPNTTRCSANYPQTCNTSGTWENSLPSCGPCKECNAGTCNAMAEPDETCNQPTILETGDYHTCAILPNKTMQCWGYNALGQLGLGDTNNRGDNPNEMGQDLPRLDIVADTMSAGTAHTCARLSTGNVQCWGNNAFGQLGLGDTNHRGDQPNELGSQVDLGGSGIDMLSAGETHTCALASNGAVKCWGGNYYGQLGLGDTKTRGDEPNEMGSMLPAVDLGANATLISAGNAHTCVRLSSIAIKCWGNNAFGQLGLGDTSHRGDGPNEMGNNLPEVDIGLPAGIIVKDIRAGAMHSCALLSDGTVKCWGNNQFGQLGQGNTNHRGDQPDEMGATLPIVELGLGLGITVTEISAGGWHTCALLSNGRIKCWGRNDFGQLGLGDTMDRGDEPNEMGQNLAMVDLGVGVTAVEVHAGHGHTCALLSSGRVKCWGRSVYGQLGQSDTITRGDESKDMGDALLSVDL